MPLTKYHFANAVSAFFEMPRDNARELLPSHLLPLEVRHGQSVLQVTAFDFTDSLAGPYKEIYLAVIVPPLVRHGGAMPKSALFPFMLATTTKAARDHAIERWHLPHYMKDVSIDFEHTGKRVTVKVRDEGGPVLDLAISEHAWTKADDLYQSFMIKDAERFKVDVRMAGRFTQHEEESGELTMHDHPVCSRIRVDEIASYPFREIWMKDGVQTFQELEPM
jgi:hypothetical protein